MLEHIGQRLLGRAVEGEPGLRPEDGAARRRVVDPQFDRQPGGADVVDESRQVGESRNRAQRPARLRGGGRGGQGAGQTAGVGQGRAGGPPYRPQRLRRLLQALGR